MKNTRYFLIVAAALAVFASAGQAKAGGSSCCSGSCCDDGIAASPKVRAMLDERCKSKCVTSVPATVNTITRQTDIAASPRVQQMRNEPMQATVTVIQTAPETVGYQPTGPDGCSPATRTKHRLEPGGCISRSAPGGIRVRRGSPDAP